MGIVFIETKVWPLDVIASGISPLTSFQWTELEKKFLNDFKAKWKFLVYMIFLIKIQH